MVNKIKDEIIKININNSGFTLVELLSVIVVLAIVMGIAVYSASYVTNKGKEGV